MGDIFGGGGGSSLGTGAGIGDILGLIGSIFGAIGGSSQNAGLQNFLNTSLNNQSTALKGAGNIASEEAAGLPFQQLVDAQKGAISTLNQQQGGIPNQGNLTKQLFGQGITNALESSINTRESDLANAGGTLLNIGSQYGGLAQSALSAPRNTNPWGNVFAAGSTLANLPGLFGPSGGSTANNASGATGTGTTPWTSPAPNPIS
jgi:hypothetical protein